jgi:hypothetical protein
MRLPQALEQVGGREIAERSARGLPRLRVADSCVPLRSGGFLAPGRASRLECLAQNRELSRNDPIVDPRSPALLFQEPGVVEDFQMMADGRLRETERPCEVANTRFARRLGRDEAQHE